MGKERFNWWGMAMNITRDYPRRKKDYDAMKSMRITTDPSVVSGVGGSGRKVEDIALRQLTYQEQKEYDTVRRSLEITKRMKEGELRYEVVKCSFWKGMTIRDIAGFLPATERTIRRWRWEFIVTVGWQYGSISEGEYRKLLKKYH